MFDYTIFWDWFVISPFERRFKLKSKFTNLKQFKLLNIKTLNIQKTNNFEKGIATFLIEYQFLYAIKKYFNNVKFDLILYSTPPITLTKIINYIKKRDKAHSYLLLKDIFPQNAVDLKFFKKNGFLHRFFRKKEKKLYLISDTIGCMSQANVDYLIKNNPNLNSNKIEINPNSIKPIHIKYRKNEKELIRNKYRIPLDKKIFVYGGNLGLPQGLDFLLETIVNSKRKDVFFLIIGSGTEFNRISAWFKKNNPKNACLLSHLVKSEYDKLLASCDVGLIFLNKNFTIPNYPSRLLSYLEMKMPIITATDGNTDIGNDIEKNKCGFAVKAGDLKGMEKAIDKIMDDHHNFNYFKNNSWLFLNKNFDVANSCKLVLSSMK